MACDKLGLRAPKGPPASEMVIGQICASEFGGPRASVQAWRDDEGQVTILELLPDPKAHARVSSVLYDRLGREKLMLPAVESPASTQALDNDRRREMLTEDAKRGETLSCAHDAGT